MSDELIAALGGAIVGAIIIGLLSWRFHRVEQVSSKKDELRRILMVLLDLRVEIQKLSTLPAPQSHQFSGIIFNKKMIYLEAVENLVMEIPKEVSSSEYVTLADDFFWSVSDFTKSEKYYIKAVHASRADLSKVITLRSLAWFYFSVTPRRSFDKGRKYFQQAVDVLNNASDAYMIYSQGYTYERWGLVELQNGFRLEASQKLDRARKYYEDLPPNYPLRDPALQVLENNIKLTMESGSSAPIQTVVTNPQFIRLQPDQSPPGTENQLPLEQPKLSKEGNTSLTQDASEDKQF